MQHPQDVDIGFNLYDLKTRPASSPTSKKAKPRRNVGASVGSTSPATDTRLNATAPQPRRPATERPTHPGDKTITPRPRPRGAPVGVASTRAGAQTASASSAPAATAIATGRPSTHGRPSSSSATTAGELELSLQALLTVEEQLLDEESVRVLTTALRTLQQARKARKGARPAAAHNTSRRSSRTSAAKCDDEGVVDCLVRACDATSHPQCLTILCGFYETRVAPLKAAKRPPCACLVGAAMADLVLSRVSTDTDGAAPSSSPTNSSPSSDRAASAATRRSHALEALDEAVARGHPGAMLRVGLCLRDGVTGVAQDLGSALTWIERAAATGYCPATHELGRLYENGFCAGRDVLDEDWGAALVWYRKGAERGHRPSQLDLGKLLLMAESEASASCSGTAAACNQLRAQAVEWLESAAAAQDQEAIRLLQRLS